MWTSARRVRGNNREKRYLTIFIAFALQATASDAGAQISCGAGEPVAAGDILVSTPNTVFRVDPQGMLIPEVIISPGYSAIAYDEQGRLIGNRGSQIVEIDLASCKETILSDGGSLADARDMVIVGDTLYATDDSSSIRGVIEVDLTDGSQRLVTSSAGIVFPDIPNLLRPRGITVNSLGHLFVVDQGSPSGGSDGRIVFVNPGTPYDPADPQANQTVIASGYGASLPDPGVVYNFEMQDPLGIVAELDTGDLLVTDQARVMRFDQNGYLQSTINVGLPLLYFNDIEIQGPGEYIAAGNDTYGSVNAVVHVTDAGSVTNLTPMPGALFQPRHVLVVPPTTASFACGDLDGSESITATDALIVLQSAVGSRTCEPCICDVDSSGETVATDALVTLKFAVGHAVTLSCPACT